MAAISITDFTNHPDVVDCLRQLKAKQEKDGLILSDVIDSDGHQYVNLVQKGGGVLGVALVGYTFILEEMGIRFIRLAGTSAGAINTALMTVIGAQPDTEKKTGKSTAKGDKKISKSREILDAICSLNFFDLVDGHPAARGLIKWFIRADYSKQVSRLSKWLVTSLIGLPVLSLVSLGLESHYPTLSYITKLLFILTGVYYMLVLIIAAYTTYLLRELKNSGFGINPGEFFLKWIEGHLKKNNVHTVSDLINVAETPVPDLQLRPGVQGNLDDLNGDVTFITSELVTQNKIEFPGMWKLFRTDMNQLEPAGFVRASMSIPFFFESYFITNIPCDDDRVKNEWKDTLDEMNPPTDARFVDGGILSNFPINLFYNPKVIGPPRLPSFGIDLDDTLTPEEFFDKTNATRLAETSYNAAGASKTVSNSDDAGKHAQSWSLTGYLYRIFNTIRFYYDKDFLIKNAFFRRGVGKIPLNVKGLGWLDFSITDEKKVEMFVLGAKAATKFLIEFSWEDYKAQRPLMQQKLNSTN